MCLPGTHACCSISLQPAQPMYTIPAALTVSRASISSENGSTCACVGRLLAMRACVLLVRELGACFAYPAVNVPTPPPVPLPSSHPPSNPTRASPSAFHTGPSTQRPHPVPMPTSQTAQAAAWPATTDRAKRSACAHHPSTSSGRSRLGQSTMWSVLLLVRPRRIASRGLRPSGPSAVCRCGVATRATGQARHGLHCCVAREYGSAQAQQSAVARYGMRFVLPLCALMSAAYRTSMLNCSMWLAV